MSKVKRPITNSRFVYPDHISTGKAWTKDGGYFRYVYSLLSKLKVIDAKKVLKDYL